MIKVLKCSKINFNEMYTINESLEEIHNFVKIK